MEPEPEPPGAAFFTLEPEPESAPGPWPPGAGAAQKSGGSATLPVGTWRPWWPVCCSSCYYYSIVCLCAGTCTWLCMDRWGCCRPWRPWWPACCSTSPPWPEPRPCTARPCSGSCIAPWPSSTQHRRAASSTGLAR